MKIFPRWHGEPVARLLKRLEKSLERDGWRASVRRTEYFLSESQRRRMRRGRKVKNK